MTQQPKDLPGADLVALENLVDDYGLDGVVSALGTIAWMKANRVRAIWFNESAATKWSDASKRLREVSKSRTIRNTSPK